MRDSGSGSGSGSESEEELLPQLMMWMSVCSEEFGDSEAEVVCREAGCASCDQEYAERVKLSRSESLICPVKNIIVFLL